MGNAEEARWYLVHCKPRQDGRALEHLERQGYTCYRPVRTRERVWAGRRYVNSEAVFPNYLFIHLDRVNDNWAPIRSTIGVHQLVQFNNTPVPVPDEIVEGIRGRLAGVTEEPYLSPGEHVVITAGPFSQLDAIFVANDGDERVVLLLNILQRDQRLSFPVGSVRKVG